MTDSPKEWWTQVDAKDEKLDGNDYDAGYHDGIKEGITRGVNMMVDKCKPVMRALWLARADRAKEKASFFKSLCASNYKRVVNIYGIIEEPPYRFRKNRLRFPEDWVSIFLIVERKCRSYADKFKEDK